jgi:hypothetical protein
VFGCRVTASEVRKYRQMWKLGRFLKRKCQD